MNETSPDQGCIPGIRVDLRYVQEDDAEFVFRLRSDPDLSRHLSAITGTVQDQRSWIARYKEDEARGLQHYFIVQRKDRTPCGLVRIYNVKTDRFTWGSFILGANSPPKAALETALLSFGFGFGDLGGALATLDVRRENKRAIAFYRRFGMRQTGENDIDLFFELSQEAFLRQRETLQRAVIAEG